MTTDEELFDAGLAGAGEVRPVTGPVRPGERITTLQSPWHTTYCDGCGHTFRRGDRVRVDQGGAVRHTSSLLSCAGPADGGVNAEAEVLEFTEGLERTWPVRGELPIRRTEDEPHLLLGPIGGLRRHVCLFCAHTFRPGELVIVCPCQAGARRLCRRAVHRDPSQGLVCWETWSPASKLKVCPVMLTKLED
ncbi:hypothetical protein ACFO1B_40090 [Dactylosporangium siamense]|uniref:Uncharacterized protein n=1 Tax=Dactylosporangium siamense TaxID=685454 RepID=A0A919PSC3_9ACTN|nr:hypothetical protein [Dactylosporangium siamense]GIG49995.1 hypothetical protein Dsi01nite_080360 [Dactylosporangium siamense]